MSNSEATSLQNRKMHQFASRLGNQLDSPRLQAERLRAITGWRTVMIHCGGSILQILIAISWTSKFKISKEYPNGWQWRESREERLNRTDLFREVCHLLQLGAWCFQFLYFLCLLLNQVLESLQRLSPVASDRLL